MALTFGSLFAGIGGFDLGFERAGMKCVFQVEIDEFCRRVLAKHWPDVRRHDDVKTFPPEGSDLDEWRVDVICGGFPCQDISVAGKGAGIDGERSGLWSEYIRIVRVLRPQYVIVENVPALLGRGLCRVLGELVASGYDAEWDCLPAAAVGAPHIRDRLFVVGTRDGVNANGSRFWVQGRGEAEAEKSRNQGKSWERERIRSDAQPVGGTVPNTEGERRGAGRAGRVARLGAGQEDAADVADTGSERRQRRASEQGVGRQEAERGEEGNHVGDCRETRGDGRGHWAVEPGMGRVADGVPDRVDRLRGLGNAVVPQVAEWIGRRLVASVNCETQEEVKCDH